MSVLSDRSIRACLDSLSDPRLRIEPLADGAIQPASVDIRLGHRLQVRERGTIVDPLLGTGPKWVDACHVEDGAWLLWPDHLYLGVMLEFVQVPNDLLCLLHGRSTLAREGITIHQQAGLLDPGYQGHCTFEITVTHLTRLRPEMPIGQLTFHRLTTPAEAPYGSPRLSSKYQGNTEPVPARPWKEVAS